MKEIVLATSNLHKLKEINDISMPFGIKFIKVDKGFNPEETGLTFEENAYIKAFEAAKITNKISLADDTGLCVEKLNGAPGIYSARYADTQAEKIFKLLEELKDVDIVQRNAYFACAMVAVKPNGEVLHKTFGKINGTITTKPLGEGGFGYDPVFYIPQMNKTMAQLSEQEKNTISHRAKALLPMIKFLKKNEMLE